MVMPRDVSTPVPSCPTTCLSQPIAGKAGELGLFAPWIVPHTTYRYANDALGLFIAPLYRAGIESRNITAPFKPSVTDPATAQPFLVGPYTYQAVGVRFGQFRYFSPRTHKGYFLGQTAPIMLMNVDYTIGRSQTYARVGSKEIQIPWRHEVRFTTPFPGVPVYGGFTANFGTGASSIRIFVGLRYDFAEFWEKLRRARLRR
jgi:hypothetical protein